MRHLNYELRQLCKRNRDGSFATQANRHKLLQKMANDLNALGYRGMRATSLRKKHVLALVLHYQATGLTVGTLKNRLAILRWWALKIEKPGVVAKTNTHYGIGHRTLVTATTKAQTLDPVQLNRITDAHLRCTLQLQAAFGLRREEALKFVPSVADQGDHIHLRSTWCKGGRARIVPVRTDVQRQILNTARKLVGQGSLIPADKRYVQQLRHYEKQTAKAGFTHLHGLRHTYAQTRYQELTGWPAPVCGGPISAELTDSQKAIDLKARLLISSELGHRREQITAVYLGR